MEFTGKIPWAFNGATVMHSSWTEELALWQKYDWRAAEVWYSKIEPQLAQGVSCEQLARQMNDAGVTPIGMCAGVILTQSTGHDEREEMDELLKRLDTAAAMGVPSLTVIAGGAIELDYGSEYRLLATKCRKLAELAEERDVRINLEFLGQSPVNGSLGSCIEIVNAVDHPNFGLLFDFCHYYVSASHIEEIGLLAPEKLFMVHVNDVRNIPMEIVKNEQRCFPGEGRMDVVGMIDILQRQVAYSGYYSIELYDQDIWKMDPDVVMTRLASSLREIEERMESRMELASAL